MIDLIAHQRRFPHVAVCEHEGRAYGIWMIGNNYKRTADYYGAYPPSYIDRVYSLFPMAKSVLHLFSGALSRDYGGIRVDIHGRPDIKADARALPFKEGVFDLVLADPPYSKADAQKYDTTNPSTAAVMRQLYGCCKEGGHVVWLCTHPPLYKKEQWELAGLFGLHVGTNKRFRSVVIMRRK